MDGLSQPSSPNDQVNQTLALGCRTGYQGRRTLSQATPIANKTHAHQSLLTVAIKWPCRVLTKHSLSDKDSLYRYCCCCCCCMLSIASCCSVSMPPGGSKPPPTIPVKP